MKKNFSNLNCFIFFWVLISFFSIPVHAGSCFNYFKRIDSPYVRNPKELRIVSYNMLNLYMHVGNHSKRVDPSITQKPKWALNQMEGLFIDHPFDILVGQEIESISSAVRFSKEYLNDEFDVMATTTHDKRGLYTVFFIRKELPFDYQLDSHVKELWLDPLDNSKKEVFPRDLPTLHIYKKGEENNTPFLTLMGVHFKSLRDRDVTMPDGSVNKDVGSYDMREAQAHRATKIVQRYQLKYGLNHPILLAGDFNNSHNYSPEYYGFYRHIHLQDSLVVSGKKSFEERVTHTFFGKGRVEHHQLDGVLMVPSLVPLLIDSFVISYRNRNGRIRGLPKTKEERKKNPSDHRPIMAIFKLSE